MKNTLENREIILKKTFDTFENWESKYKHIIELGKSLSPYPLEKKTDDFKITGCQSQVWLWVELSPSNTLKLFADSDALITKGLISLIVNLYQDLPPEVVLNHSPQIFKDIGLFQHLSPSRANGLSHMIRQLKTYAFAYNSSLKK